MTHTKTIARNHFTALILVGLILGPIALWQACAQPAYASSAGQSQAERIGVTTVEHIR